jgi:glycosyltransferase involved in cell wall biosynthesis
VSSPVTVSVVIPTYNRRDRLRAVLSPLLGDGADEIVVVDDGGADGSYDLLCEWAASESRLVPVRIENRGEAGARQEGAKRASGDVVLFLDDDVVARPDLVSGHRRHHAAERGIVVLGYMPTVLPRRRRPGQFTTFLYHEAYERRVETYADADQVLRHLWAGNFSLRRDDCLRVGLKNPQYPALYHQDRDFGLRCRAAGLRGVFDRSLVADHHHARPVEAFRSDCRRQGAGLLLVHELHPEVTGPFDVDVIAEGLPPVVASIVARVGRRPAAYRFAAATLVAAVRVAGALHAWRAEDVIGKLLRRVERYYGAVVGPDVVLGGANVLARPR